MQIISVFVDYIKDEMSTAKTYLNRALAFKAVGDKARGDKFLAIAEQKIKHAEEIHTMVVDEINQWRKEHGEPPEQMKILWEHQHRELIEKMNKIKIMVTTYKSN